MPPAWAIAFLLSALPLAKLFSAAAAFALAASSLTVKLCTSRLAWRSAAASFSPFSVAASNGVVLPAW
eukprot:3950406-Pyramimonas_sp.AAC.1